MSGIDTINFINEIVQSATTPYRKGPSVVDEMIGELHVTHLYGYAKTPDEVDAGMHIVDLHFIDVGVNIAKARLMEDDLKKALRDFPEPSMLAGGPSYIAMGAALGDQEMALRLFALGSTLGMWTVVTPEVIGFEGETADDFAGRGFVMCSGWGEVKQDGVSDT